MEYLLDVLGRTVAEPKPNRLRRGAMDEGELVEVRILRNHGKAVSLGVLPDLPVIGPGQTDVPDMRRPFDLR
jgi:hypothetical protein